MITVKAQRGFTLLELMIAMAIFAALAVIGWQVFDSVNRARERAQRHADNLAVLQYAYLQLQQDSGQIVAYQAPPVEDTSSADNLGNSINSSTNNDINNSNNANSNTGDNAQVSTAKPFMHLDAEQVSFVRFADPDPRYQTSPSIQRVDYIFADQRLIRRQYTSIDDENETISLDTVLLEGVTMGRWNAYLPELSPKFPNLERQNSVNATSTQDNNPTAEKAEIVLLPKGISVSFSYQKIPITWQFAIAPQPVLKNNNTGNNGNNGNNGNANTGNNNAPENTPNVQ